MENIKEIERVANKIRRDSVKMTFHAGGGHVAPVLGCADIVASLYLGVLRYNVEDPAWADRDRFILSKGHAVHALYSILAQVGIIKEEDNTYGDDDTRYIGHAPKNFPGIDFATGSMGHGPSVGAGIALAAKKSGSPARTFVLCGDGEIEEGSVWEAAMFAVKYGLDNLTVIVDSNGLQHDGAVDDILPYGDIESKFKAFGWDTAVVDGHDIEALIEAMNTVKEGVPRAIIAKTIKGKGVSFMEGQFNWHHGRFNPDTYKQAMAELGEEV